MAARKPTAGGKRRPGTRQINGRWIVGIAEHQGDVLCLDVRKAEKLGTAALASGGCKGRRCTGARARRSDPPHPRRIVRDGGEFVRL